MTSWYQVSPATSSAAVRTGRSPTVPRCSRSAAFSFRVVRRHRFAVRIDCSQLGIGQVRNSGVFWRCRATRSQRARGHVAAWSAARRSSRSGRRVGTVRRHRGGSRADRQHGRAVGRRSPRPTCPTRGSPAATQACTTSRPTSTRSSGRPPSGVCSSRSGSRDTDSRSLRRWDGSPPPCSPATASPIRGVNPLDFRYLSRRGGPPAQPTPVRRSRRHALSRLRPTTPLEPVRARCRSVARRARITRR